MDEAEVALLGGHTVEDPEIKYGLAVTGIVHPKKILTNAGARPGDLMVLTKPLGTGIISTALKGGVASKEAVTRMAEMMIALNRKASEWMQTFHAHACTDITGFSFIGHALEMAIASQVGMVIHSKDIPLLPEAMEYAELGLLPAGGYSNRQFFSCRVEADSGLSPLLMDILYDPQTSGGLLISLSSDQAQNLVEAFKKEAQMDAWIVGQVVEGPPGKIQII